ncbi:protein PLANT CADMIUM RESISTANCE 2-like [Coffea eugenioides]|uniref:protein PLANT CADMIUM RESISTANCE 2-like n=1 Tax=Coffea eugenioides TaxID=49369 RepID=UPI000F609EFB|nr:protein PLANT CADMIUM RESISTANCE 2-like [Coffea eugenioides]
MYPSVSKEYQKSPPPSAPPAPPEPPAPPYSQPPVTGIPVIPPANYHYVDHYQPRPQFPIPTDPSSGSGNWSTGLCGCCSDCSTCCLTCWLPCVTFGQVAEIVDKGSTPCVVSAGLYGLLCYFSGCGCIYSGFYRNRMRRQYMLPESPCPDFLVHCCCECCALCQEHRHLKSQGFDMSLGWRENVERQNGGRTMSSPVIPQGMNR